MKLRINGEVTEAEEGASVSDLLEKLGHTPGSVVVAINEQFIPRPRHPDTQLQANDRIEILAPMQGG